MYTNLQSPKATRDQLREVVMKVGDILHRKGTRIATVRMNETVATAARLLRSENVSSLVVKDVCRTEGNVAVGMFSERDVVRAVAQHGASGLNMKVSALISVQHLVSCSSHHTIDYVRHLMDDNHIRHLPVIDDHTLIGVISMRDINGIFENVKPAAAEPAFA
jgi:CBS domain-containing protein